MRVIELEKDGATPVRTISAGPQRTRRTRYPRIELAVAAAAAVVASILATFWARHHVVDDAYIYLRYVHELLAGHGWSYNPGQTSDAATSPLFVLLLAGIRLFGFAGKADLLVAYAIGLAAIFLGMYFGLRRYGPLVAAVVGLSAIVWPAILEVVGLETSCFMAVVILAALAYESEKWWLAGVLSALACLGRPEGIVVPAGILALDILRHRRLRPQLFLPSLVLLVPWEIFQFTVNGSFLPHTLQIKQLQAGASPLHWWSYFLDQIPFLWFVVALAICGTAEAIYQCLRGHPFSVIVVGFGFVQIAGYSVFNAPWWYAWYLVPGDLAVLFAAGLGVVAVTRALSVTLSSIHGPRRTNLAHLKEVVVWVVSGVAAASLAVVAISNAYQVPGVIQAIRHPYPNSTQYMNVATWLKDHAHTGDWVALQEIGYVGYYSGLNVLDMEGLLENNSAKYLANDEWDWWYVHEPKPEYIVMHGPAWPGEPNPPWSKIDPWPKAAWNSFVDSYHQVFSIRVPDNPQAQRLIIYARNVRRQ